MIKSVFYEQNLICLPIKIKSDCEYVRVKTLLLLCLCGCTDAALQSRGKVWKKGLGIIETRLGCLWQDLFTVFLARAYISCLDFPFCSISLLSLSHTANPHCGTPLPRLLCAIHPGRRVFLHLKLPWAYGEGESHKVAEESSTQWAPQAVPTDREGLNTTESLVSKRGNEVKCFSSPDKQLAPGPPGKINASLPLTCTDTTFSDTSNCRSWGVASVTLTKNAIRQRVCDDVETNRRLTGWCLSPAGGRGLRAHHTDRDRCFPVLQGNHTPRSARSGRCCQNMYFLSADLFWRKVSCWRL